MTETDRDRDASGRANNNRPRDSLGRPLAYDAVGVEPMTRTASSPPEVLALAQELLAARRPFQAHEVLEEAWKRADPAEREFWQSLAQLAVAVTHAARGNPAGASTLLRRCARGLAPYLEQDLHSVPSASLREWAVQQAQALSQRPRGDAIWLEPPPLNGSGN